jgi:hypothetical protein
MARDFFAYQIDLLGKLSLRISGNVRGYGARFEFNVISTFESLVPKGARVRIPPLSLSLCLFGFFYILFNSSVSCYCYHR